MPRPRKGDTDPDRIVREFFAWMAWVNAGRPARPDADELLLTFIEVSVDLPKLHPEIAWPIILRLVAEAPDDETLGMIGAAPLENLLWFHGPTFVDRIEAQARADPRFAHAVRLVSGWKEPIDNTVSERLAPFWRRRDPT
jgi:hypothetical protein